MWPITENTQKCGEGSTTKSPVRCKDCIHWWTPDGQPLGKPQDGGVQAAYWSTYAASQEDDPAWWDGAKLCTRYACSPTTEEHPRMIHLATHGEKDCCGDGQLPKQDDDDGQDQLL